MNKKINKKILFWIFLIFSVVLLAGIFKFNILSNNNNNNQKNSKNEIEDIDVKSKEKQDFAKQNPAPEKDFLKISKNIEKNFTRIIPVKDENGEICSSCAQNILSKIVFLTDTDIIVDYSDGYNCHKGKLFLDNNEKIKYLSSEINEKCSDDDNVNGIFVYKIKEKKDIDISKKTMNVKIPKWEFSEKEKDFVVEFKKYEVPYSKAILNATLKKLFELRGGDSNKSWNGLKFDSATIENKKAIIKLSGKWHPAGDMSGAYMASEIKAAIFQFSSIDSFEVMVNKKIFDWCIDDVTDGESGCPSEKQLWKVKR